MFANLFKWSVFGLFFVAGAWLLAFGPRPVSSRPTDRVVVQYWEKWVGHEAAQMQQIVDDFNNTVGKEKGIFVEYLSMSNVHQKTLIATTAGVPPDVAGVWDGQVAQFAAIDALEPLDEMAAAYGIREGYYKNVYWKGCQYEGKLYALISTPAATALHYNKRLFLENAEALRAAGCDPERPPRTLAELDRYARALTKRDGRTIMRAGYLPMEPGWFVVYTSVWFGGELYDEKTRTFMLTSEPVVKALEWIQSYSRELGAESMSEFRSGLGNYNSAQNPFFVDTVAMVQQGPWMANNIENNKPAMNRWKMSKEEELKLPWIQRRDNYVWGAAPFPSVVTDGMSEADKMKYGVTHCSFDVLVIPRGAKHKKEAFEFIAYVNRIEVMEKLCALHCKNSPLAETSPGWVTKHPNPYIDVFEALAASPNAYSVPRVPIWPEVNEELNAVVQRVTQLRAKPADALAEAQVRLQAKLDQFYQRQEELRAKRQGG